MLKNQFILVFALFAALAFSACSSAPKTPEDFGKAVFDAMKNHSEKDFRALYLNEKEFHEIIDRSSLSEDAKNQERGRAIGLDKAMEKLAIESFVGLERLTLNYSIDWSKANFKKGDVRFLKTIADGVGGKSWVVLFARKPFFLGCGHNLTITDERRGAVMVVG
jgi:hypothetical protein